MPDKGLENLKRDDQMVDVMGQYCLSMGTSWEACSGKLIYAVVKVLKSSN
jgi:hypothetical protein